MTSLSPTATGVLPQVEERNGSVKQFAVHVVKKPRSAVLKDRQDFQVSESKIQDSMGSRSTVFRQHGSSSASVPHVNQASDRVLVSCFLLLHDLEPFMQLHMHTTIQVERHPGAFSALVRGGV